jgi:hypothetical protein
MAISTLWPKPPRWPIQPGAVDPNQRWVWHTRPRFILPLWEHASAGAAQRYVRLAQTRRTARTWQLNTGAAAMRTPWGPGVSIPTDNGAEIEVLAGSNPSFAAWEQDEPYTIALLIKGRSGGTGTKHLYRSGSSSTADHILFLTSGTTPNLRHQSISGTVTITSSVGIVNDTTWSTIVATWRPGRLELYVDGFSRASSTAAATNTSALFDIYRWGWGFSTSQDFNGDIALIACFASVDRAGVDHDPLDRRPGRRDRGAQTVAEIVDVEEHKIGLEAVEQEARCGRRLGVVRHAVKARELGHAAEHGILGPRGDHQQPGKRQRDREHDARQDAQHQHTERGAELQEPLSSTHPREIAQPGDVEQSER